MRAIRVASEGEVPEQLQTEQITGGSHLVEIRGRRHGGYLQSIRRGEVEPALFIKAWGDDEPAARGERRCPYETLQPRQRGRRHSEQVGRQRHRRKRRLLLGRSAS